MNIAALVSMGNSISTKQTPSQSNQTFGNVFGEILSSQQVSQATDSNQNTTELDMNKEVLALLNMDTLQQLESLLGGDELTVETDQLKEVLGEFLEEDLQESEIWNILAGLNAQASQLMDTITGSLNGQGPATQLDAKKAVELLKIAQLIGKQSDLTLKQESTLFDINQLLENLKAAISKNVTTGTQTQVSLQGMKPVVQQVVIKQVSVQNEVTLTSQAQSAIVMPTKVETVSITIPTEKPAQSEEFLKELQKLMNRVQLGQTGGANRLVIKLYPEQLGTIRIELIQKDGILTAKMLASTALGKELLDSNSSHLRQGFANQNIQVERLEITQALQDASKQDKNQAFNESFKQQQQEQQENNSDEPEEQSSFRDFLMELEV